MNKLYTLALIVSSITFVSSAEAQHVKRTELPNGLVIVTKQVTTNSIVSVVVALKMGSLYETDSEAGLCSLMQDTIIKGTNDDQVGKLLQFAIENIDVVSGILYQPICFTGRIDQDQRQCQRYTLGDLAWDISESLENCQVYRDFYPLSITKPFSTLLQALQKAPKITCNCHPDCSLGTYLLVSPQSSWQNGTKDISNLDGRGNAFSRSL